MLGNTTNHKVKHGSYGTTLYKKWCGMKQRCYNDKMDSYKWYEDTNNCTMGQRIRHKPRLYTNTVKEGLDGRRGNVALQSYKEGKSCWAVNNVRDFFRTLIQE